MKVLAFITDLFFQAKVAETARQAGVDLTIVTSLYKFLPALSEKPSVVVIDLEAQGISGPALVSQVKDLNDEISVIAYASHKKAALIEQAERSGADQALPRSRFSQLLPELLTQDSEAG